MRKISQEMPTEAEKSFRPRNCQPLHVLAVVSHVAFLTVAMFCALHWTLFVLTWILGIFSFVLAGLTWIVKQHGSTHCYKKPGVCGLCRDVVHVIRLALTILLPMLLASFDDSAFLLAVDSESISTRADTCSVRQLPQLYAAGYMSFECADGFIAVDLQMGIPAWDGTKPGRGQVFTRLFGSLPSMHRAPAHRPMAGHRPMQSHRHSQMHRPMHGHRPRPGQRPTHVHQSTHGLHNVPSALLPRLHRPQRNGLPGETDDDEWMYPEQTTTSPKPKSPVVVDAEAKAFVSHTVGKSEGNRFGFVAPIYVSLSHYEAGDVPVAWAVKAGSPVKRSSCPSEARIHRTCGMFALRLQDQWGHLPGPPNWFGRRWGFNISHFSKEQMLAARREVIRRFPDLNLTGNGEPTFVVAEDAQQYFGRSFCGLWVAAALMMLGLMDRVIDLLSTPSPEQHKGEEDSFHTQQNDVDSRKAWDALNTDEPPLPQPSSCMLTEASQFWFDALGPSLKEGHSESGRSATPQTRALRCVNCR